MYIDISGVNCRENWSHNVVIFFYISFGFDITTCSMQITIGLIKK